jgi:hypothetical protein
MGLCAFFVHRFTEWWDEHQQQPDESSDEVLLYLQGLEVCRLSPNVWSLRIAGPLPRRNQKQWAAYKFVYLGPKERRLLPCGCVRRFLGQRRVGGNAGTSFLLSARIYFGCFGKTLYTYVDICDGMDAFFPGLPEAREHAIEIVQEAEETILYPQVVPYSGKLGSHFL